MPDNKYIHDAGCKEAVCVDAGAFTTLAPNRTMRLRRTGSIRHNHLQIRYPDTLRQG